MGGEGGEEGRGTEVVGEGGGGAVEGWGVGEGEGDRGDDVVGLWMMWEVEDGGIECLCDMEHVAHETI